MTLPNFLIIGGHKCGTTSLYSYLKQHPQIYMPELKEPRFLPTTIPIQFIAPRAAPFFPCVRSRSIRRCSTV